MANNKNSRQKPSTKAKRPVYDDDEYDEADDAKFATTVKGVIAVMITFMLVMIVLMFTARSMFVLSGNEVETIKGRVTSTEPTVYEAEETTAAEEDSGAKKKRTAGPNAKEKNDETTGSTKLEGTTQYRCVSAVYLHPKPSAESENTLVIPQGAVVEVQKEENGWYYLDYNGTVGWAYGTFFTINQ
ncbi:MAG: SH3 domain-containing protein [Ruminococcus sp.]|nr:SH3 domain-containing protein [Ruminococcus sp.]